MTDLPGMWEEADLIGGETDAGPEPSCRCDPSGNAAPLPECAVADAHAAATGLMTGRATANIEQIADAAVKAAAPHIRSAADAKVAEYENAINWGTSCTSCARILDSAAEDRERAERAEAELARLRDSTRMLARIVATDRHVMEAARIEMGQNGPHKAMQWILNSLPDVWDGEPGTEWDGRESAQAWFDRITDGPGETAGGPS